MMVPMWDQAPLSLTWGEKVALVAYRLSLLGEAEPPLAHGFDPGFYTRLISIPGGMLFVGRRHNIGHELYLLEGECIYITPDGEKHHVKAPYMMKSSPGFYAVCYTISPIKVLTKHPNPTSTRNIDQLELEIFEPKEDTLALGQALSDRIHYAALCSQHNIDDEKMRKLIAYQGDFMETKSDDWYIGASFRNDMGVFTRKAFKRGETIGLVRVEGKRTKLGRCTNHAEHPNTVVVIDLLGDMILQASKDLNPYDELTIDYATMLDNEGLKELICQAQSL